MLEKAQKEKEAEEAEKVAAKEKIKNLLKEVQQLKLENLDLKIKNDFLQKDVLQLKKAITVVFNK
jgi:hypothetical protein